MPLAHREDLAGDAVRLGQWIRKCRTQTAQLTAPQIAALTALGIDLEPVFQPPAATVTDPAHDEDAWWTSPEGSWWTAPARSTAR